MTCTYVPAIPGYLHEYRGDESEEFKKSAIVSYQYELSIDTDDDADKEDRNYHWQMHR